MVIISNVCKYYVDIPRPRVNTMLTQASTCYLDLVGGGDGDGDDGDGSFSVQLWL